ncbi:transposase [aff. Roholtiella sp. LEGE 12411]|uniref:transposase n=1 Tax=aff. Roholtiella sp. LEGE 12411 TaxID=1828822 RepID=UPI001880FDF3|nr:transposase [aff. Roholtiella sp. LEGE 12411]MBE9036095.1 transposase [aff. Roholtiella sp. LEGE 12411]
MVGLPQVSQCIGRIKKLEATGEPARVLTKSATISLQADRWFISFGFDVEITESISDSVVGVDIGVKSLATFSTGEVVLGAKSYKKYSANLSRMQWFNRHQIIDSNKMIRLCRL